MNHPLEPACIVKEVPFAWLVEHEQELVPLLASQPEPTPFQSLPWLTSWWQAYGQDYDAHILTVQCNGELVGVVPLMSAKDQAMPVLEWLGAGRSDHAPLLLQPDFADACLEAALSYLYAAPFKWCLLSLRTLQESQCKWLRDRLPSGRYLLDRDDISPRTVVQGNWDEYLARKSRKHRGNIKRLLKQAQELPALQITCVGEFTAGLLDEIMEVERRSWKAQEGSLRLEGEGRDFYQAFLQQFAAKRQLELWTCRYNETLLAYIITLNYQNAIFYYNGAYRSDCASFHPDLSPGSLLIASALKSAHDRGARTFDFLRGDEPYKKLWVSEERYLYHVVIRAPGLAGWFVEMRHIRLRWWLRKYPIMHAFRQWAQRIRPAKTGRRAS